MFKFPPGPVYYYLNSPKRYVTSVNKDIVNKSDSNYNQASKDVNPLLGMKKLDEGNNPPQKKQDNGGISGIPPIDLNLLPDVPEEILTSSTPPPLPPAPAYKVEDKYFAQLFEDAYHIISPWVEDEEKKGVPKIYRDLRASIKELPDSRLNDDQGPEPRAFIAASEHRGTLKNLINNFKKDDNFSLEEKTSGLVALIELYVFFQNKYKGSQEQLDIDFLNQESLSGYKLGGLKDIINYTLTLLEVSTSHENNIYYIQTFLDQEEAVQKKEKYTCTVKNFLREILFKWQDLCSDKILNILKRESLALDQAGKKRFTSLERPIKKEMMEESAKRIIAYLEKKMFDLKSESSEQAQNMNPPLSENPNSFLGAPSNSEKPVKNEPSGSPVNS